MCGIRDIVLDFEKYAFTVVGIKSLILLGIISQIPIIFSSYYARLSKQTTPHTTRLCVWRARAIRYGEKYRRAPGTTGTTSSIVYATLVVVTRRD